MQHFFETFADASDPKIEVHGDVNELWDNMRLYARDHRFTVYPLSFSITKQYTARHTRGFGAPPITVTAVFSLNRSRDDKLYINVSVPNQHELNWDYYGTLEEIAREIQIGTH